MQRYALTLLTKVWLLIAGLYRRAGMFEDAQGAFDEALKHVKKVETAIASQQSSAKSFGDAGWGGLKSGEELWADVYAEKGALSAAQSKPHEALIEYEGALSHFPDHSAAIIGLSTILLDIYCQIIPAYSEASQTRSTQTMSTPKATQESLHAILARVPQLTKSNENHQPIRPSNPIDSPLTESPPATPSTPQSAPEDNNNPEALDRIAARDRAYGLLSSLTKLGSGWDNSTAWFALARAYEESGQVEKAKEVLWWVVELEEKRPIREWWCLGQGFSL